MDFNKIKKIFETAEITEKELSKIIDGRKKDIENIRLCAEEFYQERYKETLTNLSVDTLSVEKSGIRVAYLKDAGITNMYQLSLLNYSKIRAIEGIGTQNAKKINNLKNEIVDNLKRNISMRINVDNPSASAHKLVRALCVFLCREELRSDAKSILKELQKYSQNKSLTEKAAIDLYNFLKDRNQKINTLIKNYKSIANAPSNVYMAHFNRYSSSYYSTLEKYCKKITAVTKIKSNISEEFLKEINSQRVNLTKFKATLRPYQLFGVKYMIHQQKTLLCD